MFGHSGFGEKWGAWKIGRRAESDEASEERLAEAKYWEEAMQDEDTPKFAGEWGYGIQGELNEDDAEFGNEAQEVDEETEETLEDELSDVRKITNYGFDTASRIYGLETVIDTIMKTDEIVGNAENPLGVIYQALVPSADERVQLYREIRKDTERSARDGGDARDEEEVLGFNQAGDFYDKTAKQPNGQQKSVEAIRAVRKLMGTLETDERFDKLREKAYLRDQSLIECLMEETENPTVSQFLDNLMMFGDDGVEVSEGMVEEVLDEIGEDEEDEEMLEAS